MRRRLFKGNANVPETVHDVTETITDRGQEVLREAQKVVDRTGTKARWVAEDLMHRMGTRVRHAGRFVERNAVPTALTAFALGALISGAIFATRPRK